jgi:hypothetical protein
VSFDLKKARAGFAPDELDAGTGNPANVVSAADVGVIRARYRAIYIRSPAHRRVHLAFDRLRALGAATRGMPQRAVRNSAHSGSGKTANAETYEAHANAGAPEGTIPVLYVELDKASTVKRLWASVNEKAGDEYSDQGSEDMLRRRAFKLLREKRVELLIVDEAQHLSYRSSARNDVTDSLKKALDDGVVPIALVGNEELAPLLSQNVQLSNRMDPPCDLTPLNVREPHDRSEFMGFVRRLDEAMLAKGIVSEVARLDEVRMLGCLYAVSSGIIGRVFNLVEQALVHALERGATRVELHDLAVATDRWAIAQKVVDYNPFRTGAKL